MSVAFLVLLSVPSSVRGVQERSEWPPATKPKLGRRLLLSSRKLQGCDTCTWANDDVCDVPKFCDAGTDCSDCGTPSPTLSPSSSPTTETPTTSPSKSASYSLAPTPSPSPAPQAQYRWALEQGDTTGTTGDTTPEPVKILQSTFPSHRAGCSLSRFHYMTGRDRSALP